MNSSKNKGVYKIPADLLAEFDALLDSTRSGIKIKWTKEQDALIVALWPKKNHVAFVEMFIKKYGVGSKSSVSARYRTLTGRGYRGEDNYGLLFPE